MKRDGKIILIAEHRISYLSELIDRVIYIEHGRIKKAFTSKEFFCMTEDERKTMGLRRLTSQDITSIENRYNTPTVANTLEIRGLSLTYGKHTVLHDINFSLKSGDCVGIVGKNGTGKSTLSRFLCGLHKQRSGGVFLDGKPLRIKDRRRLCGIVMQDVNYQLFSDSVYGECLLGNGKITKGKVDDILKNLNLYEFRDIHPQSLSGGQKQRLAIEFRLFNSTLHAGKIKAYIQLCHVISHQALTQKCARKRITESTNEKYTFRTWLLRLGMIGEEFKTARTHLLENLDGCIAWKDPSQALAQKERIRAKKEQEQARQECQTVPQTVETVAENEELAEEEAPVLSM